MKLEFHSPDYMPACGLTFVIIGARYKDMWVFVRHRKRNGYELPAGHIDPDEDPDVAAARELGEETGAVNFDIQCIATYTVSGDDGFRAGRLYYAGIRTLGQERDEDEIGEVVFATSLPSELSFPFVQGKLFAYLERYHKAQKKPG
ncbi:MAG: NUDIX domain-containing protein [Bacteroidales bacterium]|nr:NUDIX domain-containing protein [Bacteroidales bacterium]